MRGTVTFHGQAARAGTRSVELEARILHADGTVTELGRVAYWHRNPLRRWAYQLRRLVGLER